MWKFFVEVFNEIIQEKDSNAFWFPHPQIQDAISLVFLTKLSL